MVGLYALGKLGNTCNTYSWTQQASSKRQYWYTYLQVIMSKNSGTIKAVCSWRGLESQSFPLQLSYSAPFMSDWRNFTGCGFCCCKTKKRCSKLCVFLVIIWTPYWKFRIINWR